MVSSRGVPFPVAALTALALCRVRRKGTLLEFGALGKSGKSRLAFRAPSRGLIGFQSELKVGRRAFCGHAGAASRVPCLCVACLLAGPCLPRGRATHPLVPRNPRVLRVVCADGDEGHRHREPCL
jgi:hypothetical protein